MGEAEGCRGHEEEGRGERVGKSEERDEQKGQRRGGEREGR